MLLIGENIHIISKLVRNSIINRDETAIAELVKKQSNMDFIDLNIGPAKGELAKSMSWLVDIVQKYSEKGLSFDTSNISEIEDGFSVCRNVENVFINSTSGDEDKLESMTNLASLYNCNLVALTMCKETGIPKTSDARLELAFLINEKCLEKGISNNKVYFDPLVIPVSVEQNQAVEVLNTIKMLKESFEPQVKTIIGLSNISNGSPLELRPLINRVFCVMAYGAGLDAAIVDACDLELFRIIKMLDSKNPASSVDELYLNIAQMVESFSEINDVQYNKEDTEQSKIIRTAKVLLGNTVYSHSFTQI